MIALVLAAALQAASPGDSLSVQPLRSPELQASLIAHPDLLQSATWADPPQQIEWPRVAFDTPVEGEVTLGCVVDTAGRAKVCEIVSETPEGSGFGEAAIAGQDLFRWHPARFNGEAIESRIQFNVNFRLEGPPQANPELEAMLMPVAEAISAQGYATGGCRHFADPATVQHWDEMQTAIREHPNAEYRYYDRMFTEGYRAGRESATALAAGQSDPTASRCADMWQWADQLQKDAAPAFSKLEALSFPNERQQYRPAPDMP
ncbi:MAG: energy transducer TonB [Brevundimonas sp.]